MNHAGEQEFPVIRLVDNLLAMQSRSAASDIHFEPTADTIAHSFAH